MNLEEIENKIKEKNQFISDESRKARLEVQQELNDLHAEKKKLLAQKRSEQCAYLKDLQPIINYIVEIAFRINISGSHTLWVEFSGHVNLFKVNGFEGEYASYKETSYDRRVYLDLKLEDIDSIKRKLLEIASELKALEETP